MQVESAAPPPQVIVDGIDTRSQGMMFWFTLSCYITAAVDLYQSLWGKYSFNVQIATLHTPAEWVIFAVVYHWLLKLIFLVDGFTVLTGYWVAKRSEHALRAVALTLLLHFVLIGLLMVTSEGKVDEALIRGMCWTVFWGMYFSFSKRVGVIFGSTLIRRAA